MELKRELPTPLEKAALKMQGGRVLPINSSRWSWAFGPAKLMSLRSRSSFGKALMAFNRESIGTARLRPYKLHSGPGASLVLGPPPILGRAGRRLAQSVHEKNQSVKSIYYNHQTCLLPPSFEGDKRANPFPIPSSSNCSPNGQLSTKPDTQSLKEEDPNLAPKLKAISQEAVHRTLHAQ